MKNLKWYYYRFTKMNILELLYRTKIFLNNKVLARNLNKEISSGNISFNKTLDFFSEYVKGNIKEDVKKYYNNEYLVFNEYIKLNITSKNKYLTNYINGKFITENFFTKINFDEIDPKPIWEINKQYQLLQLAIMYSKTGDVLHANRVKDEMLLWINENRNYCTVNWCSNLEMAIRNINWLFTLNLILDSLNEENKEKIFKSIYIQAKFIYNRLSLYSSSNNHLIGELTFILFVSKTLVFKESKKWYHKAKKLLEKQISNQFYKDGINKEQSINYQVHTMEFYLLNLLLLKNNNDRFSNKLEFAIKNALEYIYNISENNGNVFNIGDQDSGNIIKIDCKGNEILDILHIGSIYFNEKKYIEGKIHYFSNKAAFLYGDEYLKIISNLNFNVETQEEYKNYEQGGVILKNMILNKQKVKLYFDYGNIGMGPLFAHAHSDILSFNLSVNGKMIFADMGTYKYKNDDKWRDYFRGVFSHNTVSINGENQFEFLGPFICKSSPKTKLINSNSNEFEAVTYAYRKQKCDFKRKFSFNENKIIIEDNILNYDKCNKNIQSIFNFDSEVNTLKISENEFILKNKDIILKFVIDKSMKINQYKGYNKEIIRGYQSKKFNQIENTNQIIGECISKKDITIIYQIEVI